MKIVKAIYFSILIILCTATVYANEINESFIASQRFLSSNNDDSIWQWMYYVKSKNEYFMMNKSYDGKWYVSKAELSTLPHDDVLYAVKSFTSPYSGTAIISHNDAFRGESGKCGRFKIMLNDTKIWPKEEEWYTNYGTSNVDFIDFEIEIEQNDKIYFVAANGEGDSAYTKCLDYYSMQWDPKVVITTELKYVEVEYADALTGEIKFSIFNYSGEENMLPIVAFYSGNKLLEVHVLDKCEIALNQIKEYKVQAHIGILQTENLISKIILISDFESLKPYESTLINFK